MTVQVTAVEEPNEDLTLILGVRVDDLRSKLVGFLVPPSVAVEVMTYVTSHRAFPEMEVDPKEWFFVFATGERTFLRFKEKE